MNFHTHLTKYLKRLRILSHFRPALLSGRRVSAETFKRLLLKSALTLLPESGYHIFA